MTNKASYVGQGYATKDEEERIMMLPQSPLCHYTKVFSSDKLVFFLGVINIYLQKSNWIFQNKAASFSTDLNF